MTFFLFCYQINYLAGFGGRDPGDTTRRILRKVFTNELSTRLNFAGHGLKVGIGTMTICTAIVGMQLSILSIYLHV